MVTAVEGTRDRKRRDRLWRDICLCVGWNSKTGGQLLKGHETVKGGGERGRGRDRKERGIEAGKG